MWPTSSIGQLQVAWALTVRYSKSDDIAEFVPTAGLFVECWGQMSKWGRHQRGKKRGIFYKFIVKCTMGILLKELWATK